MSTNIFPKWIQTAVCDSTVLRHVSHAPIFTTWNSWRTLDVVSWQFSRIITEQNRSPLTNRHVVIVRQNDHTKIWIRPAIVAHGAPKCTIFREKLHRETRWLKTKRNETKQRDDSHNHPNSYKQVRQSELDSRVWSCFSAFANHIRLRVILVADELWLPPDEVQDLGMCRWTWMKLMLRGSYPAVHVPRYDLYTGNKV